jgi:hypothetical protein
MMTRRDECQVCGKEITNSPSYIPGECQFPLSHAHGTIENIKLPGRVAKILNRLDSEGKSYPSGLTLQERDAIQNTRIHHNDFTTELETPAWNSNRASRLPSNTPHSASSPIATVMSPSTQISPAIQ